MVKMHGFYVSEKTCELIHDDSVAKIRTDAPKDNGGQGLSFSPTDLLCSALASCITTTWVLKLGPESVDFSGTNFIYTKTMSPPPRQVQLISLEFKLGSKVDHSLVPRLLEIAKNCPVSLSLHPSVQIQIKIEV